MGKKRFRRTIANTEARSVLAEHPLLAGLLDRKPPPVQALPDAPKAAQATAECATFDARVAPVARLHYRQAVELAPLLKGLFEQHPQRGEGFPTLSCTGIRTDGIQVSLALDLLFEQSWQYQSISIADLQTTISLAPGEELTLEFRTSQRKTLEQTTLDSVEQIDSLESTTTDKDIVNVARSASRSNNWEGGW